MGKYLRVTESKETRDLRGFKISVEKVKQCHYQNIVSGGAEELNEIDNIVSKIFKWECLEFWASSQGAYKVIACKECDPITGSPQYYKVIKKDSEKQFYKLIKAKE